MRRLRNTAMRAARAAARLLGRMLLLPIAFYQKCVSPYTPPSCRFVPTCSEYARQAIVTHGPLKGLLLAVWRLLRCNPWGGSGYDPVPPKGRWRNGNDSKHDTTHHPE